MRTDGSQGTDRPRLGTTAWPPGLLLPIPDRWPADFATRELLDVDPTDRDSVASFLASWGDEASPVEIEYDVDAAARELAWAQRCAVAVREIAIASQEDREPRSSVLLGAIYGRPVDPAELVFSTPAGELVEGVNDDAPAELVAATVGEAFVEAFLSEHLRWAYPRLAVVGFDREPEPHTWADAVAGQLYNYVSQRTPWQQCDNEPAHPDGRGRWFTVHRTDRRRAGGYGPRDAGSARFCSRQCARAYTERERRRRLREQREAGQQ